VIVRRRVLCERPRGDRKIDNLEEQWDGNVGTFSFTAKGYDISGTLTVEDSTIELNGKIPFAVSLFKGAITRAIDEKAGSYWLRFFSFSKVSVTDALHTRTRLGLHGLHNLGEFLIK